MKYRDRDERGGMREPPLPKPYAFVPLPAGRPATEAPAGHHRYHAERLSGALTAQIISRSPVHVASGLLEQTGDRTYPLVKAHVRTQGTPAIPGASLKGCVRSIVEAISHSAVSMTRARPLPREVEPSRHIDRLDVAQRIFGTLGYQGLVQFGDALQTHGEVTIVPSMQLFRPRTEAVDTYFDGRQPRGRKFYMHGKLAKGNLPLEACAVDSRFALQMAFENLTAGELGLLLIALGLGTTKLWPKLGGAKSACLGTIEVIEPQLVVFTGAAAYADFDAAPQPQPIAPLLEAAQALVLQPQLARLAELLRWPNAEQGEERQCPDRSY